METTDKSKPILIIILLLGLLLLFTLPIELPNLEKIRIRPHAIEKHGEDALVARNSLLNCGDSLRARLCPPSSRYGLSVCFWCETGESLCPGMYTTIGGMEKTTFIRPCEEWRECR